MSTRREPLPQPGAVLFGQTRRRVLGWLFGHPDEEFYLREIVRHTGAAQGAVQRELEVLTRAGLLRRTVKGRQVYFQANHESPIFVELHRLIMKTAGAAEILREALAPLAGQVLVAFVFGSAARGELRGASDVDLLVIGDVPLAAVAGALAGAQEKLGREVNPVVYPADEFRAKVRSRHHFLTSLLSEPRLFVMGGPDELDRLGAQRLAERAQDEPTGDRRAVRRRRARSRR